MCASLLPEIASPGCFAGHLLERRCLPAVYGSAKSMGRECACWIPIQQARQITRLFSKMHQGIRACNGYRMAGIWDLMQVRFCTSFPSRSDYDDVLVLGERRRSRGYLVIPSFRCERGSAAAA